MADSRAPVPAGVIVPPARAPTRSLRYLQVPGVTYVPPPPPRSRGAERPPACRNYLWIFAILVVVWGVLMVWRPSFLRGVDGRLAVRRVFWLTLGVTVAGAVLISLYQRC